jgi:hypothetical protein
VCPAPEVAGIGRFQEASSGVEMWLDLVGQASRQQGLQVLFDQLPAQRRNRVVAR